MENKSVILAVFIVFWPILMVFGQINTNFSNKLNQFLQILGKIESNNNDLIVGDGGLALGRYQIHRVYFKDAQKYDKSLQNIEYQQVTNKAIADRVVAAYILRYCPRGSYEDWARLHNGGPNWKNKTGKPKENLDKYWRKFKLALDKHQKNP